MNTVHQVGARRVVDLGCGEGYYLRALVADPTITEVVGVDVSPRALAKAERRLNPDRLSDHQRAKVLAAAVVGDLPRRSAGGVRRDPADRGHRAPRARPDRIAGVERVRSGPSRPRDRDHPESGVQPALRAAGGQVAAPGSPLRMEPCRVRRLGGSRGVRSGYRVSFRTVGDVDPDSGSPTQLALSREDQ